MTSQKSLKNNVNINDFKRGFIGSLLFPTIAFFVLFCFITMPVIEYVISDEFLSANVHFEYSMFLTENSIFSYMFDFAPIGMVICGMLTALKSFKYLLTKKQVNVFLSLGIKRNTMFINRLVAGIISLFLAVFIPIFVICIVNIVSFGMSTHVIELFLYFVSILFVSALVGYAITSSMMMVSGNVTEVVFSSIALSFIPFFVITLATEWLHVYLKGYTETTDFYAWVNLFNPWTIATNLQNDTIVGAEPGYSGYVPMVNASTILGLITRDTTVPFDEFKLDEALRVDIGFTFPIIFWFIISLVLIGVTFFLFNRRKAEHANSLGKFPISRAVLCTVMFFAVAYTITDGIGGGISWSTLFLIIAIVTAVLYLAIQLVLTRRFKVAFKSLSWCCVLVVISAVGAVTIGTGLFGTYNKIPDVKDVKSVSIDARELPLFIQNVNLDEGYKDVECTSDDGKKAILEAYELLKDEKYEYGASWIDRITLAIKDNDGKVKYRTFTIYEEETYAKYLELVYGSEFFDVLLKEYFASNDESTTNPFKQYMWTIIDAHMLRKSEDDLIYFEPSDELADALYKDLSAMTFEQLFKNTKQPLGVLVNSNADIDYVGVAPTYADDSYFPYDINGECFEDSKDKYNENISTYSMFVEGIPVYEEMTNTVNYFKEYGYEFVAEELPVKEILYTDAPIDFNNAIFKWGEVNQTDYTGWGTYTDAIYEYKEQTFSVGAYNQQNPYNMSYFFKEKITAYDLLNDVYEDAGHPLISVTDTGEIDKIMNNIVSNEYLLLGDNGRYVYVIYEDGPIMCHYLPEANVSVIK